MKNLSKSEKIIQKLEEKACLKQTVFDRTQEAFRKLKEVLKKIVREYNEKLVSNDQRVMLSFKNISNFQCELKVGGDLLIFYMHSNVFEFDRNHDIWKTSYIKKNRQGSFSGIISIYNFLSDSFKYNRINDLGYLIARLFVNKDAHYFVEGKQQMAYLTNDFGKVVLDEKIIRDVIESAILYTLKFDLLVSQYDNVKITTVEQIIEIRKIGLKTGKRLGYSFKVDDIRGKSLVYTGG